MGPTKDRTEHDAYFRTGQGNDRTRHAELSCRFNALVRWHRTQSRFSQSDTTASLEGASTVVRLAANRQGHYLLPGAVNGVPVQFLVDTGATQVVIPAHLASRLALERGRPLKAKTAAGWITVYQTALSSIDLAGIELENIPASLNPAMQGDEILLGMSALTELELSIAQDTLTLRYRH